MVGKYRKADQSEGFEFHQFFSTGGTLSRLPPLATSRSDVPYPVRTFHRGELQAVLVKQLKTSTLHVAKRLVTYTQPAEGPVELHFQDGSTATCDFLVGSDGIRSTVRRTMYTDLAAEEGDAEKAARMKSYVDPVWTGMLVYRTLVPRETAIAQNGGVLHPALLDPAIVSVSRPVAWFNPILTNMLSTVARIECVDSSRAPGIARADISSFSFMPDYHLLPRISGPHAVYGLHGVEGQ